MRKRELEVESCEFIGATALVPRSWDSWFWKLVDGSRPKRFQNVRSLVDPQTFREHCEVKLRDRTDRGIKAFLKRLTKLPVGMLVDLES